VSPIRRRLTALGLDVIGVVGFVALGRSSHSEGEALAGIATVAAPFLVGLGVGWLIVARMARPTGMRAGIVVWACTVVIGLVMRGTVVDRVVPAAFVAVTTAFLGVWLVGWRAIWMLVERRSAAPPTPES
jgi:hypothetical protein